jgi:hypothetical protein
MDHGNDILMANMLISLYGEIALRKAELSYQVAIINSDLCEAARWARIKAAVRRLQPLYAN